MKAMIARTLSAAYEELQKHEKNDLTEVNVSTHDLNMGMSIQLQNLVTNFGNALGIEDWDQWYYDCGMRICGTPQVGICDWCKSLSNS